MAMTVDGLVSGMNTTDTINQLMRAEALPQTALKTKVTTQNKVVAAYQAVNTKVAAVADAANVLGTAGGTDPRDRLGTALGVPGVAVHLYGKEALPGKLLPERPGEAVDGVTFGRDRGFRKSDIRLALPRGAAIPRPSLLGRWHSAGLCPFWADTSHRGNHAIIRMRAHRTQ